MNAVRAPRFRSLDRGEIDEILARNHVGRLAYAWKNHVDIEPLHYVYHGAGSTGAPRTA
jgi:nitroimidazol reductase NimA-like FMN-containing flavoprotein (pyridoxamine 5'-phosphate oxidase superfamily)